MNTLKISNVSKIYQTKNKKKFYALKNINLDFPNNGLVSIVGKSGSGKSTLLNLIAMLDSPSEGELYYMDRSYSSFKRKEKPSFYQNEIGIVFQNFNLIQEKTVLYNVTLPLLIKGIKKNKAEELAIKALDKVGIKVDQFSKLTNELSGGEQQRVGIARAIVSKPKILLCDEPTGHLDISNSIKVMDILKSISKERLVILVSHNLLLVKEYSDKIIYLSNGEVTKIDDRHKLKEIDIEPSSISKNNSKWTKDFFLSNFKKRFKRNLFTSLCLVISFSMFILVSGFINGKDKSISNTCYRQFNYGSGSISKEEKVSGTGMLNLTKSIRPTINELRNNKKITNLFEICPNFSTILYQSLTICYDEQPINELDYKPIYSFKNDYVDSSLIIDGYIPKADSLKEVVINQFAKELIKKKIGKEPVGEYLTIRSKFTNNYVTEDEEYITDIFNFEQSVRIVGVVKELNYLSSEKIYFSHLALEDYFHSSIMFNLSTYNGYDISWFDYVINSPDISIITSYSYNLFLKDYRFRDTLVKDIDFGNSLSFTSESLLLTNSLKDFVDVAEYGIILFTIISFVGSVLILGIMSFVSYSEDRKTSAILTFLGSRDKDILDIYLGESFINGLISLVLSIVFSILLEKIINLIIYKNIELSNLIQIPFISLFGIKFIFPILLLLFVVIVVFLATSIPILFSKFKNVKEELQSL